MKKGKEKGNKPKKVNNKMEWYDYLVIFIVILFLLGILLFGLPSRDYYPGKP